MEPYSKVLPLILKNKKAIIKYHLNSHETKFQSILLLLSSLLLLLLNFIYFLTVILL